MFGVVSTGTLYEQLGETSRAEQAYDNALRHNPYNARVLTRLAAICRAQKLYPKAIEQLLRLLDINSSNGEVWSELGHCYLMTDELQKAFTAYQNALYNLQNPKVSLLDASLALFCPRPTLLHTLPVFCFRLEQAPAALSHTTHLLSILDMSLTFAGHQTVVRNWDTLRPLWLL